MEAQDKQIIELAQQIAVKCEAMDAEEEKWNDFFLDKIEVYLGRYLGKQFEYWTVKFNLEKNQYIEVEPDRPHTPGTFLQTFDITPKMKDRLIENIKNILLWK